MPAPILTYSPADVTIHIQGYQLGGLCRIGLTWRKKPFTLIEGIRGIHTRVFNKSMAATLHIDILQTSITNDVLTSILLQDMHKQTACLQLTIKDMGGSTVIQSDHCYISGFPIVRYDEGIANRVWEVSILDFTSFEFGGNSKAAFDIMSSVTGAMDYLSGTMDLIHDASIDPSA